MHRTSRQLWLTAAIVALGIVAAAFIVFSGGQAPLSDLPGHGDQPARTEKDAKGPHGGKLLTKDGFAVEVTIFEKGVPPEFRVYAYENGKPVNPSEIKLRVNLTRLGAQPEAIAFRAQQDFLRGEREVAEPHSFGVEVLAEHKGRSYGWTYEQAEGRVKMDDATAKSAGIRIETAGPARIRSVLQLQGEIQLNPDRLAHVVPRLEGVVLSSAKNLGDPVRKGELLAVLDSPALADLTSTYLAAQDRLGLAQITFEREKRLWEEKISAEQDYLASRQALTEAAIAERSAERKLLALGLTPAALRERGAERLTRFEIRAPLGGVVVEKHLGMGESVKEDATIFVIADLSTVAAEVTIYPADLNAIKLGQKVTVRAAALNAEASGTLSYVGALVGEQTRTAKARITLANADRRWRPGLFVTVEVVQNETEVPVAVPVDAIQTLRDWKIVFARFGDLFEARPVELGRSDGKRVEILKGLAPGARYAAANSFVLKADLGKAGASHGH